VTRVAIKFLGIYETVILLLHNELQTNLSTSSTFREDNSWLTAHGDRVMRNTAPPKEVREIAVRNSITVQVSPPEVS
jgi:hypothetical protein